MTPYPKRLIEVDLPIRRISAHERREKSTWRSHGHISALHIWWARRPLAACRAVICAALLDFITDFANWDASTVPAYLETARGLTQAAHEALGGEPGTRPLVVDPFAGGGAIPLEALRVGADAFASDLNPVAVLLNTVVLEYIPKYGNAELRMMNAEGEEVVFHGLAEAVHYWGQWIKEQAERELAEFYAKDPDGATPIAYQWARTNRREGPGCGAEVPLMRSLELAQKGERLMALRMLPDKQAKRVDLEIVQKATAKDMDGGTIQRGAASCPICGYTTPVESIRQQRRSRRGVANNARLLCLVMTRPGQQGRFYRLPLAHDLEYVRRAASK